MQLTYSVMWFGEMRLQGCGFEGREEQAHRSGLLLSRLLHLLPLGIRYDMDFWLRQHPLLSGVRS